MRFQDIPGLNDIKSHLISAFENNRIAHAQLFSGIEGSGAFPLSIAFATFLLCKNKDIKFYKKFGWKTLNTSSYSIENKNNKNLYGMSFNLGNRNFKKFIL